MEKYSLDRETLIQSLRDEEAQLMSQVAEWMAVPVKTAAQEQTFSSVERRLQQVRSKISEFDLGLSSNAP